jgi:hypothetical protein
MKYLGLATNVRRNSLNRLSQIRGQDARDRARSLVEKLGIRRGQKVGLLNPPSGYDSMLTGLPEGISVAQELSGEFDFIQFFAKNAEDLDESFGASKARIKQSGMIWASWPKGASRALGGLRSDIVREIGLRHGLVDVKVCSIDQNWSALKFVTRVRDRR